MLHWLYEQAHNTSYPKRYFNAYRALLKYNGRNPEYLRMKEHLYACHKLGMRVNHNILTRDGLRRIPPKHLELYEEVANSPKPEPVKYSFKGQQRKALNMIKKWLEDPNSPQKFILYGLAGTGKTTIASEVATWRNTLACAYTGKAALELAKRGLNASTIHSAIYVPEVNETTGEVTYHVSGEALLPYDLIILDECGMVNTLLDSDLVSCLGNTKMLVMGDPYQIPTIDGTPAYRDGDSDYTLTEIMRQALDNPIIYLAHQVREGKKLQVGDYGESRVIKARTAIFNIDDYLMAHLHESKTIVGTNRLRKSYNERVRQLLGYTNVYPEEGELLISTKNHNQMQYINGQMWYVQSCSDVRVTEIYRTIKDPDTDTNRAVPVTWATGDPGPTGETISVQVLDLEIRNADTGEVARATVPSGYFDGTELHWKQTSPYPAFDFASAITGHKAQGSTYYNTFIRDESFIFPEPQKWLYSVIGRAANNTIIAL